MLEEGPLWRTPVAVMLVSEIWDSQLKFLGESFLSAKQTGLHPTEMQGRLSHNLLSQGEKESCGPFLWP